MRKLLCVTPLFPNAEKPFYCIYLLQQLQALAKCEYDVSVLVPKHADTFSAKEEEYEGLRVLRTSYKKLRDDFKSFVEQDIKARKYDIIALNLCSLDLIELFAGHLELPVVIHFHGLNVWENRHEPHPVYAKLLKFKKERIYRKANALIGVSEKVKAIANKHYPANRIFTVYNGVNPKLFYPRSRKEKNSFDIFCTANLIQIKGHEFLIKALADAKKQMPNEIIHLHLIGNGPNKEQLIALSQGLNMTDSVHFEGEMEYNKIAERLGTECDMFIMPSYFESLGCVYLEAMACEVPAVGVRGCGIDEVITDGVNGFLVDPKNVDQITEKIVWSVKNPLALRKIAIEGRKTVLNKFTWDTSGKKLAETYEEIIQNYERV